MGIRFPRPLLGLLSTSGLIATAHCYGVPFNWAGQVMTLLVASTNGWHAPLLAPVGPRMVGKLGVADTGGLAKSKPLRRGANPARSRLTSEMAETDS